MLEALLNTYEEFIKNQNYPFELKEKTIAMEAILKPMIDRYFESYFKEKKTKIKSEEMVKMAEEIVNLLLKK